MTAKLVISNHDELLGLADDDHTQYLLLAGRSGGQDAFGGTGASEELSLRGTQNADLGLIRAKSPIEFDDVSAAVSLSPYSIRDASVQSFSASYVGGTFADLKQITFSNALFIYETLRGSPTITSNVAPGFAAFTLFNALPRLVGGPTAAENPLAALVLNAGPVVENPNVGIITQTTPSMFGVNFAPQVRASGAFAVMQVTNIAGMRVLPTYSTVANSSISFGTIRGLWCGNPSLALFQPGAGTEFMTAYIGFEMDAIPFGGNVVKRALRSALTAATNTLMIENTGGAESDFAGGDIHFDDNTDIKFGNTVAAPDIRLRWNSGGWLAIVFENQNDELRWSAPAADRFLFDTNGGNTVAEYNFNCARFSLGAQTGAVGNQVGVFVAGTRSTGVAGEWSDFLLTQAANITIDHAMGLVAGWTINAPSMTLGTGSVTTGVALNVGGNPSQGTNRVGLRIISNPSGGGGINAALWITAGLSRFDGRVDINNPIALGGGAAATLGTIGGSGPTAAAQAQWLEVDINGVAHWIPVWT